MLARVLAWITWGLFWLMALVFILFAAAGVTALVWRDRDFAAAMIACAAGALIGNMILGLINCLICRLGRID